MSTKEREIAKKLAMELPVWEMKEFRPILDAARKPIKPKRAPKVDPITSAGPLHPDEQISGSDSTQIAGAAKHSAEPVTTPRTGEAVAPVAGMPVPGAEIQPVPAGAEATPTVPAPARQSRVLHPKRRASAK